MTLRARAVLLTVVAGLVWPSATGMAGSSGGGGVTEDGGLIPRSWLDRMTSIEEAEADHPGITDERIERRPEAARPFGFENPRWEALKARMRPGDSLWTFASPAESWQHLAGRAGIALVRDDRVVDMMVTMRN